MRVGSRRNSSINGNGNSVLPVYRRRDGTYPKQRRRSSGFHDMIQRMDPITKVILLLSPFLCVSFIVGVGISTRFIHMHQSGDGTKSREGVGHTIQTVGVGAALDIHTSLHATAGCYAVVTHSLDETPEVTVMAWVWADRDGQNRSGRRTIFSNLHSCQSSILGYTLYLTDEVRPAESSAENFNFNLALEWAETSTREDCGRGISPYPFPSGEWVHVSVMFSSQTVTVYINSLAVIEADLVRDRLRERKDTRFYTGFHIGSDGRGDIPLQGYVSRLLILDRRLDIDQLNRVANYTRDNEMDDIRDDFDTDTDSRIFGDILFALSLSDAQDPSSETSVTSRPLHVSQTSLSSVGTFLVRLKPSQIINRVDQSGDAEDGRFMPDSHRNSRFMSHGLHGREGPLRRGGTKKHRGVSMPLMHAHVVENNKNFISRNETYENMNKTYVYSGGLIDVKYVDGTWAADGFTSPEEYIEAEKIASGRAKTVKASMKHAWSNYRRYAFGMDEVLPISKKGGDCWGGMAATLIDALDTLWIMGMKKEFSDARDWVAKHSAFFEGRKTINVFEMTIRDLGGLLSAYDLSKDKVFLDVSTKLADLLMSAFTATDTGLPMNVLRAGRPSKLPVRKFSGPDAAVLSEAGSLQVEFRYLSHVTGDPKYAIAANNIFDMLHDKNPDNGLYPIALSRSSGRFTTSHISLGAFGDSFYEYALKTWLQGNKSETTYRDMYDRAMDGVYNVLLQHTVPSNLTYIAELRTNKIEHKMDHLVCFLPGTLALGAYNTQDEIRAQRDMTMAKALMYTCYLMYHLSPSGLSPEYMELGQSRNDNVNFTYYDILVPEDGRTYNLRPEVAESLFILHQLTGDPIYREWSWEIFQAIEKKCKVGGGYGHYVDVLDDSPGAKVEDKMESFFLAETLKYLYLIHDSSKPIDLTKRVFNTEAHPLSMFGSNSVGTRHQERKPQVQHPADIRHEIQLHYSSEMV